VLAARAEVNVSRDETRILRHRHVNIGIAVAIDDGLIAPVIRDAPELRACRPAHRVLVAGRPVTLPTATRDLDLSQAAVFAGLLRES
jgi:2-oxoacid dehydrogenases acyltransferase (catalytic domain)